MSRPPARRLFVGAALLLSAAVVLLHACGDQPTEPADADAAALARAKGPGGKFKLTVSATGSTASGTLISSRGGLNCTVTYVSGKLATRGTCAKDLKADWVLTIIATPASGAPVAWTGCDEGVTDNPLACQVTMGTNRQVNAVFSPPPNSFLLSVQGGSNGSGTLTSSPAGIACSISSGAGGCSAPFPTGTQVQLTAAASTDNYVKAWAGAGCDAAGTGIGASSGTCTLPMDQTQTVVVAFTTSADEARVGHWAPPAAWPAVAIHAHLLPTGKVMTYGRMSKAPVLWDPAYPLDFQGIGPPADLFCSGHTLLPDGRLLVAGGHSGVDNFGIRTTFLYDAVTGSWTRGQDMQNGRWYPTNTTLTSGEVLTISGGDTAGVRNRIPEVWQDGSWRPLASASLYVPLYPMMFATPDGGAFMAGPARQGRYLSTAGNGAWTIGPLSHYDGGDGSGRDYGTAVMYDAGKILLVGGGDTPTSSAEVIDLNAGGGASWRYVGSLSVARRQLNATLLADGTVLATGGSNAGGFNSAPTDSRVLDAELWDPATEQWRPLSRMSHHRLYHSTALLLPDGRVLSVGSGQPAATGQSDDLTAELFSPPYLFRLDGALAPRPVITDAPVSVSYGQTFAVQTPDAATITRATWIRLSSVTHAFNQNQRMNHLTVSAGGASTVLVSAPSGPNLAPPGHYMLFLIDGDGVPSVAKIIRIF